MSAAAAFAANPGAAFTLLAQNQSLMLQKIYTFMQEQHRQHQQQQDEAQRRAAVEKLQLEAIVRQQVQHGQLVQNQVHLNTSLDQQRIAQAYNMLQQQGMGLTVSQMQSDMTYMRTGMTALQNGQWGGAARNTAAAAAGPRRRCCCCSQGQAAAAPLQGAEQA
jgi:hypothetical protein